MSEEQLTVKGAMREAKIMTKIVGPKGETEDYQKAEKSLELIDSKKTLKLLHLFFPGAVEQRALNEIQKQEQREKEEERRVEIGPKGRIKEDLAMTFVSEAKSGRIGSYSMPDIMHLERDRVCLSSYSRIKDRFLAEHNLAEPNILSELRGERFNFAMGKPKEGEEELPNVFLIGTTKGYHAEEAIELTDEYLDSLSKKNLEVLEMASSEVTRLETVMARLEYLEAIYEAT